MSAPNEIEFSTIESKFSSLSWTYGLGPSGRFYTGKVDGIMVASIMQPSDSFIIYDKAAEIIKSSEQLTKDEQYILNNRAMMFNLSQHWNTFEKICCLAQKAIKHYYNLKKREEIYAEGGY